MKAFWDPAQLRHTPQFFLQRGKVRPNFERPDRAHALLDGCRMLGLTPEQPPMMNPACLDAVHTPAYLAFLRDAASRWAEVPDAGPELVPNIHPSSEMLAQGAQPGPLVVSQLGWFTADTSCPIGPGTWDAAVAAAACAVAAADEVAVGRSAYALTRPPGHHAYAARAGGHCYLNNAAIAAERLRARGMARVAVLDVDSHHGNGTQGIFWDRGDVLFVSVHGDPSGYYPWYVGHAGERGVGAGAGYNLNLPLPAGTGDDGWLAALDTALDAVRAFSPDALVLSLGFDASVDEPLSFLRVSDDGFARAAEGIAGLHLPTAVVQEGGYNTATLGPLLHRFLSSFD